MTFKFRRGQKYLDISVSDGSTTIDLGLHDQTEAKELKSNLEDAIDQLNDFIENCEND
jgi:hypothetical protein